MGREGSKCCKKFSDVIYGRYLRVQTSPDQCLFHSIQLLTFWPQRVMICILSIARTEVGGDFKIQGTKYFLDAIYNVVSLLYLCLRKMFSVITSRVNISSRGRVFWLTKDTGGLQHHKLPFKNICFLDFCS